MLLNYFSCRKSTLQICITNTPLPVLMSFSDVDFFIFIFIFFDMDFFKKSFLFFTGLCNVVSSVFLSQDYLKLHQCFLCAYEFVLKTFQC